MVARTDDAKTPGDGRSAKLLASLFGHWRAAVSVVFRALRSTPARAGADVWLAAVTRFIARPEQALSGEDPSSVRIVSRTGYVCLAVGSALAAVVTWRSGAGALAAAADAAGLLMWAGARWAVIRLAAIGKMRARSAAIDAAWAGGLLPLVAAVTPVLDVVALAASAVLTWRAIRAAGGSKRETWLTVGAAFGGQATVEIVVWLVRGGIVYAFLLPR